MARIHLVELEDLPWWPKAVRELAMDYLHFMESRLGLHDHIAPPLAEALHECGARHIVDLCAGGSGPVPGLLTVLRRRGLSVSATLTDLYPNIEAFERAKAESGGAITYEAEPVDARAVPRRLHGFRTIFNAFHHFRPARAVAVLRDAQTAGQPIGIFEVPQRAIKNLLVLLFTPIFVWLVTPLIRPFHWRRLFWTYVIPLVPFTCWWDGLVSQLRAYEPAELQELAAHASEGFTWRAGRLPIEGSPANLTYLIGIPRSAA